MKKYCTKCGKPFEAVGREVICPSCKAQAAEDAKRAAVLKAKRASWAGESVPVRISGKASTVIRKYGEANNMPFVAALDALLKNSEFFKNTGKAWEEVEPYRSRRRDKSTTETAQEVKTASKPQDALQNGTQATSKPQEAPQDVQDEPAKPVKTAAKKAVKTTSKASTSKAGKKVKA